MYKFRIYYSTIIQYTVYNMYTSHGEILYSHSSQQTLTIFSPKPKRYLQELRKNYINAEELRGSHSIVIWQ